MSSKVVRSCSLCTEYRACVAVDDDTNTVLFCLLHYSSRDVKGTTGAGGKKQSTKVFDEEELSKQQEKVQEMWKGAAADVILLMYDYEKEEQKAARLSRAPDIVPQSKSALKRKAIESAATEKTSSNDDGELSRGESSKQNSSEAPTYSWRRGSMADSTKVIMEPNPEKKHVSTSLWRTGLQKKSKEDILIEAERTLLEDRANAAGEPCPNCNSKLTTSHSLASYDISKSETWGSKDQDNSTSRIECRECKHVWTRL